ncbi:MAG: iron-sulfur cluster assembly scaffold protein [Vicinamibacteria bacterium]
MTRYSPEVLDHFHRPRSPGVLADADAVGRAGTPGRGPYLVLYLRWDGARVTAASFQTYGCPPAIAAGSLLAARVPGLTLADARAWADEARVREALGGLPAHKHHCSRLAAEALAAALRGLAPDPSPDPSREASPDPTPSPRSS